MTKHIIKKLHTHKGTTIGEMMVCLLILVLASGLLVSGVVFASNQFEQSMSTSQTQMLRSTLKSAITRELRYTEKVYLSGSGNFLGYHSQNYGENSDTTVASFKSVLPSNSKDENGDTLDQETESYGYLQVNGFDLVTRDTYPKNVGAKVSVTCTTKDLNNGEKQVSAFHVSISFGNTEDGSQVDGAITYDVLPVNYPKAVNTK